MLWPRGIGLDCAFMGLTFLKVGGGVTMLSTYLPSQLF